MIFNVGQSILNIQCLIWDCYSSIFLFLSENSDKHCPRRRIWISETLETFNLGSQPLVFFASQFFKIARLVMGKWKKKISLFRIFFSSISKHFKPQKTKTTQTTNIKMQPQPFFFYHNNKYFRLIIVRKLNSFNNRVFTFMGE
jgi:hypothetical protein